MQERRRANSEPISTFWIEPSELNDVAWCYIINCSSFPVLWFLEQHEYWILFIVYSMSSTATTATGNATGNGFYTMEQMELIRRLRRTGIAPEAVIEVGYYCFCISKYILKLRWRSRSWLILSLLSIQKISAIFLFTNKYFVLISISFCSILFWNFSPAFYFTTFYVFFNVKHKFNNY